MVPAMRYLKGKDCDGEPIFYKISNNCDDLYGQRLDKLVSLKNSYEFVAENQITDELFDDDEIEIILNDNGI